MSDTRNFHPAAQQDGSADALSEGGLRAPPGLGPWGKAWWWFHFLVVVKLARLRFLAILAAVGAVILYWDVLHAYYDKWTRPVLGETATVSPDSEYWCPMHPTIVRDHPDKCPICGMPLSKRKKGEAVGTDEALPAGVVSRVQLTPYRVALAGVQTVEATYQPLAKEITTVGSVEFDERGLTRISARVSGKSRIDKLFVNVTGQAVRKGDPVALLYSPDLAVTVQNLLDARSSANGDLERLARERLRLWGIERDQIDEILQTGRPITQVTIRSPMSGTITRKYQVEGEYVEEGALLYDVADLSTVWIEAQVYEDDLALLKKGLAIRATTQAFPNREFSGTVAFLYPHLDTATRTIRVRFDVANSAGELRPGMNATVTVQVPATQLQALPADADEEQRESFRQGLVLAVPERAVIDTGKRKIVYRETERDVFEGVEVQLGPRCGGFYPIVAGLQPGDHVVAAGSFLIDAETRLTAGAGSMYAGAGAGPQKADPHAIATAARPSMTRDEEDKVQTALTRLTSEDHKLAEAQEYCAVLSDNRLGTMGAPVKVLLKGQPVFLCCKGCIDKALADPQASLFKAQEEKARRTAHAAGASDGQPGATSGAPNKAAKAKAALAKLRPDDRRLAEAQGFCPQTKQRLGEMGVPIKVSVQGHPVFVCCEGCVEDVQKDPKQTLTAVEEFKAKVRRNPAER